MCSHLVCREGGRAVRQHFLRHEGPRREARSCREGASDEALFMRLGHIRAGDGRGHRRGGGHSWAPAGGEAEAGENSRENLYVNENLFCFCDFLLFFPSFVVVVIVAVIVAAIVFDSEKVVASPNTDI